MKIYKIKTKQTVGSERIKKLLELVFTSELSALECLEHTILMSLNFFKSVETSSINSFKLQELNLEEWKLKLNSVQNVTELNAVLKTHDFQFLTTDAGLKDVWEFFMCEDNGNYKVSMSGSFSYSRNETREWEIVEMETDQYLPESLFIPETSKILSPGLWFQTTFNK